LSFLHESGDCSDFSTKKLSKLLMVNPSFLASEICRVRYFCKVQDYAHMTFENEHTVGPEARHSSFNDD